MSTWLKAELPEDVEPPAGDVGQIDGRGARAADSVRCHGHLVIEVDVDVLVPFAAGETGGSQAVFQPFDSGDANPPVVEVRPRTAFRGEHLLPDGIVNYPGDDLAGLFQA
jgi:hypothetical protein